MRWEGFGLPRLGPGEVWLSLLVALGRLGICRVGVFLWACPVALIGDIQGGR